MLLVETRDESKNEREKAYSYLRNGGGGGFSESVIVSDVEHHVNPHLPNPADFDNDGDMDFFFVVTTFGDDPDQLWRNAGNENHWLKLVLKGTVSNASAIGAIVRVKTTNILGRPKWQMRQLHAGGKLGCQPDRV